MEDHQDHLSALLPGKYQEAMQKMWTTQEVESPTTSLSLFPYLQNEDQNGSFVGMIGSLRVMYTTTWHTENQQMLGLVTQSPWTSSSTNTRFSLRASPCILKKSFACGPLLRKGMKRVLLYYSINTQAFNNLEISSESLLYKMPSGTF